MRAPWSIALAVAIPLLLTAFLAGRVQAQWTDPPPYVPPAANSPNGSQPPSRTPTPSLPPPSSETFGETSPRPSNPDANTQLSPTDHPQKPGIEPGATPLARPSSPSVEPLPQDAFVKDFSVPSDRAEAARQFFADYLSYWSQTNSVTRETAAEFYRPMVRFYGRLVSLDAVIAEKRRFIERWPIRDYAAQPGSLHSQCRGDGQFCTVEGLFTFQARDPVRGRSSTGRGVLELAIAFEGNRPVILSENSSVVSRARRTESDDERDF